MNKSPNKKLWRAFLCCALLFTLEVTSQSGFWRQEPVRSDQEALKLDATLVQIPTVVTDRTGKAITDLSRSDFSVFEEGKRQQIDFFSATKQPFHAVLVLDTSNSAEDRLRVIQNCATSFVRETEPGDRLMVMSFDQEVHYLTDFTSDKKDLEAAISGVESGFGKLLYEAVDGALDRLRDVNGQRSVILFTDGVDLGSVGQTAEKTIRLAEETGAVIYVVHFETRWWIESAARRQRAEHPRSKLPFSIDGRIPLPPEWGGPDPDDVPGRSRPRIEINAPQTPPVVILDGKRQERPAGPADDITESLDKLYGDADKYLQSLSSLTGGVVYQADNFDDMTSAFRAVADELRRQYLLGYYPGNESRTSKYYKVKVEVARKGVQVRARPGYRR